MIEEINMIIIGRKIDIQKARIKMKKFTHIFRRKKRLEIKMNSKYFGMVFSG
jgi:hypothetical protein